MDLAQKKDNIQRNVSIPIIQQISPSMGFTTETVPTGIISNKHHESKIFSNNNNHITRSQFLSKMQEYQSILFSNTSKKVVIFNNKKVEFDLETQNDFSFFNLGSFFYNRFFNRKNLTKVEVLPKNNEPPLASQISSQKNRLIAMIEHKLCQSIRSGFLSNGKKIDKDLRKIIDDIKNFRKLKGNQIEIIESFEKEELFDLIILYNQMLANVEFLLLNPTN
jgi:hypothetical protein